MVVDACCRHGCVTLGTDAVPAGASGSELSTGVCLCVWLCVWGDGAVLYLVVATVGHSVGRLGRDGWARSWALAPLAPLSAARLIEAAPIVMFAFSCQTNVFQIYDELSGASAARMARVARIACGISASVYARRAPVHGACALRVCRCVARMRAGPVETLAPTLAARTGRVHSCTSLHDCAPASAQVSADGRLRVPRIWGRDAGARNARVPVSVPVSYLCLCLLFCLCLRAIVCNAKRRRATSSKTTASRRCRTPWLSSHSLQ